MSGEQDLPPNLDDGELWLPSDVLSDDEDYNGVALCERLARSMLDDDDDNRMTKWTSMSRSPKSTLCYAGGGTWSSDGSSQLSSPTENKSDAWDLLDAAAGEVMRLKTKEGIQKDFQGRDCNFSALPSAWVCRERHVNAAQVMQRSWSARNRKENTNYPAHQYRQPKPCSVSGKGWPTRSTPAQLMQASPGQKSAHLIRTADRSYPPWPPVQVGGSGMRAVFLGSNGSGRESGGTGVFLPRGVGSGLDPNKKPACSTVLLPSRVVQALNLNVEDIRSQPTMRDMGNSKHVSGHGRKQLDHNKTILGDGWSEQQKKPCYQACSKIEAASSEISLPQEWTY